MNNYNAAEAERKKREDGAPAATALSTAADTDVSSDEDDDVALCQSSGVGVTVRCSTADGLEEVLSFLKDRGIPVSTVGLGPLHKKHLRHTLAMRERNAKRDLRYAVVLAVDVPISKKVQKFAADKKLPVFTRFSSLAEYVDTCIEEQREKEKGEDTLVAVFPVVIEQLGSIRDRPMILRGTVTKGHLHVGTPLCTVYEEGGQRMKLPIGTVVSIQEDGKDMESAGAGAEVGFKINPANSSLHFSRQFSERSTLYADMTRESIDALERSFLNELPDDDWDVIHDLKRVLGIADPPAKSSKRD